VSLRVIADGVVAGESLNASREAGVVGGRHVVPRRCGSEQRIPRRLTAQYVQNARRPPGPGQELQLLFRACSAAVVEPLRESSGVIMAHPSTRRIASASSGTTVAGAAEPLVVGEDRLMSIREAAEYVGASTKTIMRLVVSGDLRAYRFGQRLIRLKRSDLDALLVPVIDGGDAA
jgi:excisionase family DNA binding protein